MLRFDNLCNAGVTVAAMSDESDGHCGWATDNSTPRQAFLESAGAPANRIISLRQVHGDGVFVVNGDSPGQGAHRSDDAFGDGDGLITSTPGIPLGVTVADCVPVLIFDPITRTAGAFHAGRAGTAAAIATKGLAAVVSRFGADPRNIFAVIGPSAGPCCYEVSPEISASCSKRGVVAHGRNLDLWETNKQQLIAGGVVPEHIAESRHCTICMGGFYSFRRQKTAARNLAVIMC